LIFVIETAGRQESLGKVRRTKTGEIGRRKTGKVAVSSRSSKKSEDGKTETGDDIQHSK